MKLNKKRFLGILLAMLMIVTMVPVTTFAGESVTPVDSPNYFKIVTEDGTIKEYLYNDTITQNGKTYIGLIGTTNLSDYGAGRIGIDMRDITNGGVDYEGAALPSDSNRYLSTSLTTSWANGTYKEIHNFMSWVPTAMQGYLLKYSWDCASNALFDNYVTHTLRTIGKLTVAGIDEIEKHADYLASVASAYTGSGKQYIATRSGHGGYGFYRYTLSDGSREKSNTYQYPNGSAFMQMYVDADMFKTVKIDTSTEIGANVKTFMTTNFEIGDMFETGLYSIDEMVALGYDVTYDVSSVKLNKTSENVVVNSTVTLSATVEPFWAANTDVVWSSSDETVATVDQNGVVTGVSEGTATIRATSDDDNTKYAECEISVSSIQSVYATMTLDEFVASYGDTLSIDKVAFGLLTDDQKIAVKSAVSADGKTVEDIVAELNSKMKTTFIDGVKTDFGSLSLPNFATKYESKLDGLDVALASLITDSTLESNVKSAITIDYTSTAKSITDAMNKEMASQIVSVATTAAEVENAISFYNKHLGLDLVNWIEKVTNKDDVYAALADKTFDDFDDLVESYEKTVLITRINNVSVYTEIEEILGEYADVNGEIYGVDIDEYKNLETTDFASSLAREADELYADWAEFEKQFTDNVDFYTPDGGSGGGGGGGGGGGFGGGNNSSIYVEFAPEIEQQIIPTTPKHMFSDLGEAEWAVTYVEALAKLGHINGKGNNTFCPNDSIKREEVVKILVSALGLDVSATGASFTDVDAGAWYAPYLAAAKASGIVNGKPDGSFGVGAEITREELATMIYRAAGLLASDTDVEFADEAEIADYAKEAVSTLVATGVLNGKGDNLFAPKANATRAEASKIIYLAVVSK